jgi:hypothetical protein
MIIRNKFNGYVNGNNRLYPGGGGGPTTTTQYSTNIPEYAEPYVKDMLESAQRQIYTYDSGGNKTGFKPFQSFSQYDTKRGGTGESVAGFTPMQRQAMQGIQNYQLPGQTGAASQMAGYAGLGAMGAGQQYQQMATDPSSIQAYMSPYAEAALAPQLREAERRSNMMGQQNASQAVQAGAFGGSGSALVEAERQRNLAQQQQDIYGTGMQNAFQSAQQAQQFGSQLGLQGYEGAMKGAGLLGEFGQQQYGQELGLMGKQLEVGKTQQEYEQNRMNQIIQDYATSQQYPFMQMGILNAMLRGLPMQAATSQMYQAQPTTAAQVLGTAGALYNMNKPATAKEGGTVKEMAEGGIASGVEPEKLPYMAKKLGDDQLQAKLSDADTDPETKGIMQAESERRAHVRKGMPKMASGGIIAFAKGDVVGNPFNDDEKVATAKPQYKDVPKSKPQAKSQAKAPAPAPAQSPYDKAMAGISPTLEDYMKPTEEEIALRAQAAEQKGIAQKTPQELMQMQQDFRTAAGVDSSFLQKARAREETKKAELISGEEKETNLRKAQAWAMFASTPGPFLVAGMKAVRGYAEDLIEDERARKKALNEIDKVIYDIDKADYLEKSGMAASAQEMRAKAFNSSVEISGKIATIRDSKAKTGLEVKSQVALEGAKAESAKEREHISGGYQVEAARQRQLGGGGEYRQTKEERLLEQAIDKAYKDETKLMQDRLARLKSNPEVAKQNAATIASIEEQLKTKRAEIEGRYKKQSAAENKPAPAAEPTAEDIAFTAKKYNISEDEVRKRLGMK